LSAPIREEPSPAITSLKGAGTANAVAEARMTQQALTEFCSANAQYYKSTAHCVGQFANKTYRASADCTAGRITTTIDETYTLDGVWPKDSDGSGRTRWKDSSGSVVQPDLVNNGLYISQQWEKLCPAPVTPALIARAKGAPAAAPTAAAPAAAAALQRPPSVCPPGRLCDEVPSFAAAITDFKASQYDQSTKAVSATVRFVNKTNRPLILGYVRNASVAINEAGNRYTIEQPAGRDWRHFHEVTLRIIDPTGEITPVSDAGVRGKQIPQLTARRLFVVDDQRTNRHRPAPRTFCLSESKSRVWTAAAAKPLRPLDRHCKRRLIRPELAA